MGLSADFSLNTLEAIRQWADIFKVLKKWKKKEEKSQINNLNLQLKEVEKEEQTEPKQMNLAEERK